MIQTIIAIGIVVLATAYVGISTYKSLSGTKGKSGCAGCSGCELQKYKKGKCHC